MKFRLITSNWFILGFFFLIKLRQKSKFCFVHASKLLFKIFVLNLGRIISVRQKIWIKPSICFQTHFHWTDLYQMLHLILLSVQCVIQVFSGPYFIKVWSLGKYIILKFFNLKLHVYPSNCLSVSFTELEMDCVGSVGSDAGNAAL